MVPDVRCGYSRHAAQVFKGTCAGILTTSFEVTIIYSAERAVLLGELAKHKNAQTRP